MPNYSADLGRWEEGIVVSFHARNEDDAIEKAIALKEKNIKEGKLKDNAMVVQIGEVLSNKTNRRIFYDYMNGHMQN